MKLEQDFFKTKQNFKAWWEGESIGRPLVKIAGINGKEKWPSVFPTDYEKLHIDAEYRYELCKISSSNKTYFGEGFPFIDSNMGPGSMAAYTGAQPIFQEDTVWYKPLVIDSLEELGSLSFDPENIWFKEHVRQITHIAKLTKDTPIWPTIPDILENIDILSLLRSPQELCYDLIDSPETVKEYIKQIDDIYFDYYDHFYDIVKDKDGGCSYTAFSIWAPQKCAKLQCDFSALMSPTQFKELIVDSLTKQTKKIKYTLYHLDGVDATRHIDSIIKIKELNALQWTPGAGKADGGDEKCYPIYDKVREAKKSLWIGIDGGNVDDLIFKSKKIIRRYGHEGIYLLYPDLPIDDAKKLFNAALQNFK